MTQKQVKVISVVMALFSASAISLLFQWKTSNIMTGIIALLLCLFYNNTCMAVKQEQNKRKHIAAGIVSAIFTIFLCMHVLEYLDDAYASMDVSKVGIFLCILLGFGTLFFLLVESIYTRLEKVSIMRINKEQKLINKQKIWMSAVLVLFLCWLPYFLKNYPAVVITDSMDQIGQAVSRVYSNHHPVVQTWLIQIFIHMGMGITGELSTGIAFYGIFQMLVLAMIYGYFIMECYIHRVKTWICIGLFLFFAIMPYNVMYAINIWKDTFFSAGLLLFSLLLWKLMRQEAQGKMAVIVEEVFLVLAGCVVTLFRNNGFYAFLVVVPFVGVLCWKRNKQTVGAVLLVVVITLFVRGPIFRLHEVKTPDMIESLSIPAQQIARTIANGAELSMEESELLGYIIDIQQIPQVYDEEVSDPIKNLVRESGNQNYLEEHKGEYLKLWMALGMRYPMNYIRAFLHQTEGYWYPDVQKWVYTEGVCENSGGVVTEPKLPESISNILGKGILWNFTKIPIYGLFWSVSVMVWITFLLAGYCFSKKRNRELVLFLPMLALWGTLLVATPVNGETRYLYAIFLCVPFYFIVSKMNTDTNQK